MSKTVMLVAGEASGDLHAATLVTALKKLQPGLKFTGMGSQQMRTAGVDLIVDSTELAVMGFVEVLRHYPKLKAALNTLQKAVRTDPPELLVLIDYPGFNLKLAATAKDTGVKVLYYISPQVWAWRSGRITKIGRLVDMMAVIFPFEVPIYERANIPVTFTGHPLVDEVKPRQPKEVTKLQFGFRQEQRVVGLLPGSRQSEIKRLMKVLIESAKELHGMFPDLVFVIPVAPGLDPADLEPWLSTSNLQITLIENQTYDVIHICDAIITASGTATLQIALLEIPMTIIYKVSPLTYWIAKRLVKSKHIGIVNILLKARIVQEFVQHEARVGPIVAEVRRLLTDDDYADEMRMQFKKVREQLSGQGTMTIAELTDQMLEAIE